jgi:hypothetical protein
MHFIIYLAPKVPTLWYNLPPVLSSPQGRICQKKNRVRGVRGRCPAAQRHRAIAARSPRDRLDPPPIRRPIPAGTAPRSTIVRHPSVRRSRVARPGSLSVPLVGGIGAPVPPIPPHWTAILWGGCQGTAAKAAGMVRSGLAAPARVRPLPWWGYRRDDPGREGGPAWRPDWSGTSGGNARGV